MKVLVTTYKTKPIGATQNAEYEVWDTDSVDLNDQMSIARLLQQFCLVALPGAEELLSIRAYREALDATHEKVRFGAMLVCDDDLNETEINNLRIGCIQLSHKLRPRSTDVEGLFPSQIPVEIAFPQAQEIAYNEILDSHSGKLLDGTVVINVPELGDVHLQGHILPPADTPVKNWPTDFVGTIHSVIFPKFLVRVTVESDHDESIKKGSNITLGVPDRGDFEQCCLAGIDSSPLFLTMRSVPDQTGKVAHELESVKRLLPGDAWPIAPAG